VLHVQARFLDPALFEIGGSTGDCFENRLHSPRRLWGIRGLRAKAESALIRCFRFSVCAKLVNRMHQFSNFHSRLRGAFILGA
jgi:hypothetical protein